MTTPNKAKGSRWERDVVKFFNENGFPHVERRYGAGHTVDKGDINGFAHEVILECKNVKSISLASIMDETARERTNAGAKVGVAIIKRRGKGAEHGYAMVSLPDLIYLLKESGF